MIRLQILSGKQAGRTIAGRRFPFRIGRQKDADLCAEDAGVWDEHCQIEYRPKDGFFLRPIAATVIGTAPISEPTRLLNGTEMVMGSLRLSFSLDDPPVRTFRLRAALTWLGLLALLGLQAWLISILPK